MHTKVCSVNEPETKSIKRPWGPVLLYALARIVVFLVLTVVIQLAANLIGAPVPILISALLALIVALPLSMLLFTGLRLQVTREMAQWSDERRRHKRYVAEQLAGRE